MDLRKNKSLVVITILCAVLLGLSVAYAALNATLNVTMGNVAQSALTWNVGFEPGTVQGSKTGANAICGEATATSNSVSIANTTLTTLHDKCVYNLKIKNTGSVDAEIASIVGKAAASISCDTTTTSKMICGNITYKLTTDAAGNSLLGVGNVLAKTNGVLDVYLTAEYEGMETVSEDVEQNTGGFTINYTQK